MKTRFIAAVFCLFFVGSVSGISKTSTDATVTIPVANECECVNEQFPEVYSLKCWLIAKVAKRYLKKNTELPKEDIKKARDLVKELCETLLEEKTD